MGIINAIAFLANIFLTVNFVPAVIYDQKTGEFKGYLHPAPIFWLAVAAVAGWLLIASAESPRAEPWQYAVFSVVFVVIGSRIVIEGLHRKLHGAWLRKEGIWLLRK